MKHNKRTMTVSNWKCGTVTQREWYLEPGEGNVLEGKIAVLNSTIKAPVRRGLPSIQQFGWPNEDQSWHSAEGGGCGRLKPAQNGLKGINENTEGEVGCRCRRKRENHQSEAVRRQERISEDKWRG